MNWAWFSLCSLFFWGFSGITANEASKTQSTTATMLLYNGAMFVVAIVIYLSRLKFVHFDRRAIPMAVVSGVLSLLAVASQFIAFRQNPGKFPLIIMVGGLYPIVPMVFAAISGSKFSLNQWIGFTLAISGIILLCMPVKVAQ